MTRTPFLCGRFLGLAKLKEQFVKGINLEIPMVNQASLGTKSLRLYGPKIWNSLPDHIILVENLCFKNVIKSWNGSFCSCKVCRNYYPVN